MIITIVEQATGGDVFAPDAFASQVGTTFDFVERYGARQAGSVGGVGTLLSAVVADDGLSVRLELDLPEPAVDALHDEHPCLLDPAAGLGPVPSEAGRMASCTVCERQWVSSEILGIAVWRPADQLDEFFVTFGQRYASESHPLAVVHPDGWVTFEAVDQAAVLVYLRDIWEDAYAGIYDDRPGVEHYARGELARIRLTPNPRPGMTDVRIALAGESLDAPTP